MTTNGRVHSWGRLARRDIWLKLDVTWRVEARQGDGDAKIWSRDYPTEAEARAAIAAMINWNGKPDVATADLTRHTHQGRNVRSTCNNARQTTVKTVNHHVAQRSPETARDLHEQQVIAVARGGIEPPTFRFSVGRSYQLSYLAGCGPDGT